MFFFLLSTLLLAKEPPLYFSVKHREAGGIGYDHGYTSITGMLIPRISDNFIPFVDARFHLFNNGRFASNVGLGARVGLPWGNWALGANAYWDHRDSSHLRVNGLGAGLEALNDWIDFRVNGYLPSGKTRSAKKEFGHFSGNQILASQTFYQAIPSIFGEVGFSIPSKMRFVDLYFGVGPYYLFERRVQGHKSVGDTWGVKGRLENQIIGGVSLAIEASYDREFRMTVQGVLKLTFPLGAHNLRPDRNYWNAKNCPKVSMRDHILMQPAQRNEIIPIDDYKFSAPLVNSLTGRPFTMIFVNNINSIPGEGTFENPFWSLNLAEENSSPGSMIYVFSGDGTPFHMEHGFTFQDNQRMFGSGIPVEVGSITIPSQTLGLEPTITNIDGHAIRMANNTELAGFIIDGAALNGIVTEGTIGAVIRDNTIEYSTLSGIDVTNTPEITIVNNTIRRNTVHGIFSYKSTKGGESHRIIDNEIAHNQQKGIYYFSFGESDLNITSNDVIGNGSSGIDIFGNFLGKGPSAVISNNTISDNRGQGILFFFSHGEKRVRISHNTLDQNRGHGISVKRIPNANSGVARAEIFNNIISDPEQNFDGILIDTKGHIEADVKDNLIK